MERKSKTSQVSSRFFTAEEVRELSVDDLSAYITRLIEVCAEELDCEAQTISYFAFKQFVKSHDGSTGIDLDDVAKAGGFNVIRDANFPPVPNAVTQNRFRLKQHAQVHRKLGDQTVKQKFLLENIEGYADRIFKGRVASPVSLLNKKPVTQACRRIVNAVLSDLHYGSDLREEETGTKYGPIEEARRSAQVFDQILQYKIEHRNETELELLLLGDIFQGQLHDARDGAEQAEQVCRAIHILSQGIAYVSQGYKKVRVRCQTGNHGRNTARHFNRATHQKWDSIETILYYALKSACSQLKNVEFSIPKTPYLWYDVFGKKIYCTHGDTVFNVGNPGNSINIGSLEKQVNRINASLPDHDEYSVFVVGHVHTGSITHLSNGSVVITNGALVPQDSFAVSIGLLETQCGQFMWESTPGFPVGDARFIKVGLTEDRNARLDKIIRPWSGL